jgi:hypothetical protein
MVTDDVEEVKNEETGEVKRKISKVVRRQQQSSLSSRSNPSPPLKNTVNPFYKSSFKSSKESSPQMEPKIDLTHDDV